MSTKPNIVTKKRGDKLTAEEFNQVVNYFLKKMEEDDLPEAINGKSAYELAVEWGYEGTEEEWLSSLSPNRYFDNNVFSGDGETEASKVTLKDGSVTENHLSEEVKQKLEGIGQDGREVEFQKSDSHIQWRYVGQAEWTNLVALADIKGEDGYTPQKGIDYDDGEDGREVEIQKSATHIQWRYEGDSSWIDLISLTDLKGEDGYTPQKGTDYDDGTDGKEVEFQKSTTHIQWRYVGDTTWIDLVALEDIKGPEGDPADTSSKLDKSIQFGADISGSITLSEADNSTLREITASGPVTVPNGLSIGWNVELVNIASGDVTITASGTLRNGAANKLKPGKGCVIYHKGGNIIQAIGLEA